MHVGEKSVEATFLWDQCAFEAQKISNPKIKDMA